MDYQASDDGMPSNEEGEFELVLGNKQLLSVFFVAVLLLGVFFIMGYIVGRNLSPEPALVADKGGNIIDVDTAPAARQPAPEPEKPAAMPAANATPPAKPVETPKPVETAKAAEKPKPVEAAKKAEAPKPEPPKPEPPKAVAAKPTPAPKPVEPAKPAVAAAKPQSGATYLQVAAATPDKVNAMLAALRGKGFTVTTQQVPNQELVRILVGPYDAAAVTDGAAKLKAAGYDSIKKKL